MEPKKKNTGFEMFEEKEPGKPQNWCCTITIVILVCVINLCIIVGLRFLLDMNDSMGDPILTAEQKDIVVEFLAIMSMSFGFGCCFCWCCACQIPLYAIRWSRKLAKFICSQCTEDVDDGNTSLVKNMYDQRNYSSKRLDVESGSSGSETPTIPISPSTQVLNPVAAARARFESRNFLRNWKTPVVHPSNNKTKQQEKLSIIANGIFEPMETVRRIEQQFYCPGLAIPETPIPTQMTALARRRMTLATDTPGLENRAFFF